MHRYLKIALETALPYRAYPLFSTGDPKKRVSEEPPATDLKGLCLSLLLQRSLSTVSGYVGIFYIYRAFLYLQRLGINGDFCIEKSRWFNEDPNDGTSPDQFVSVPFVDYFDDWNYLSSALDCQ